MIKAFLSHNSAQKHLVEQVAQKVGLDYVYMDEFSFQAGNSLTMEIKNALASSKVFVLFLSFEAQESPWVNLEVQEIALHVLNHKIAFCPIIVDETFSHNNLKEDWFWMKEYLLKTYGSYNLIAHLIKEKINALEINDGNQRYARLYTFVGRDDEMKEIHQCYNSSIDNQRRAVIVAGLPHVGRKRLLKEVLIQKLEPNLYKTYELLPMSLSNTDGLDSFFNQLNDLLHPSNVLEIASVGAGVILQKTIELLRELDAFNKKIIIDDDRCIVRSNGYIADWFIEIIKSQELLNKTYFFIASRYAPDIHAGSLLSSFVQSHQIGSLTPESMKTLLIEYARNRGFSSGNISKEVISEIQKLSGYPEQVLFYVDELKDHGPYQATNLLKHTLPSLYQGDYASAIQAIEKEQKLLHILILLSKFEFVSIDILAQIIDDFWTDGCLEKLSRFCLFDVFGAAKQYIRLNPGMAMYIRKRDDTFKLPSKYTTRLSTITKNCLNELNGESLDLSAQLYALKETIKADPDHVDMKYLLPSYALKVIIDEYQQEHYDNVIILANRVLYSSNLEDYKDVILPVRHWLCLAYCHQQNKHFFEEVIHFDTTKHTYHYLQGFYARLGGNYSKAQKELKIAVGDYLVNPRRAVAKSAHELVLAYTLDGKYGDAIDLARQNYYLERTNPYHIEAYFRCLVHTSNASKDELIALIRDMDRSYDHYRDFYVDNFKAEYLYYIDKDFNGAMQAFEKICKKYSQDYHDYTHQAVRNICKEENVMNKYNSLFSQYPKY